jgi:phospholipase/carboxylesterase
MSLSYEQLEPDSQQVKKIVILSHGYGADCKDLLSIAEHWKRFLPDCLFVCPNAPTVCQINPSGYEWFDLMQTSQEKILEEFEVSLKKFIQFMETLLEKYNLEEKDIFLMGFSQGTMMSLQIALTCKTKIAGVLGYSGKIFNIPFLESKIISKPPIVLFHGNMDDIIPLEEMYETYEFLKKNSFTVENKIFENCGHSITPEGLSLGLNFIKSKISEIKL